MTHALLGFDARVVGTAADQLWSADRRRVHLLRDVPRPLSVDTLVWPSAFRRQEDALRPDEPWRMGWRLRPDWLGPNDLWESLSAMESALEPSSTWPAGVEAIWKVAVSWHARSELKPGPHGPHADSTTPDSAGADWELLGFDVADPRISGLTNCGYDAGERVHLAEAWSRSLNEHHLLSRFEEASVFVELTNARVPEHSPFFVLGLWRVP